MDNKTMRYIGRGQFIPGIPARDLSSYEVEKFGVEFLKKTGLYELIAKTQITKRETIDVKDGE